jgi:hypothetical protein
VSELASSSVSLILTSSSSRKFSIGQLPSKLNPGLPLPGKAALAIGRVREALSAGLCCSSFMQCCRASFIFHSYQLTLICELKGPFADERG